MRRLWTSAAIVVVLLVLVLVGGYVWLEHQTTNRENIVQEIPSGQWTVRVTQVTDWDSAKKTPSRTMVAAWRTYDKAPVLTEFLGVRDARDIRLHWEDPNTLSLSCDNCEVFLKYPPPPAGLTVHFHITDPSQPGKQF